MLYVRSRRAIETMKILFIYPNDYLSIGIPTGLSTLIAIVKEAGHEVSLFDYTFVKTRGTGDQPEVTPGLLPTELKIEDLVRDDPIQSVEEAFEEHLASFQPDLVCLSTMTSSFDDGMALIRRFRGSFKCKVIVGGVHATISPEDILAQDAVDLICVGEGEGLLLELCEHLEKGIDYRNIRNLGFRSQNGIQLNAPRPFFDLEELPTPDWGSFDQRHLFRPFMGKIYCGSFYVMSRGCPFRCTYCVNGPLREQLSGCGRYYRHQSPHTAVRQLSHLKAKFGATWFKFADDTIMGFQEDYLEELAEGLEPLDIQFGCSVRPETTTETKVALLKKMGCVAMSIGIESGNEDLRKTVLNRRMTNEQIERAMCIIREQDIRISTFNMIGLPEETRENVFETITFNKSLNVSAANVYILYPYPGTEIYSKYKLRFRDETGSIIPVSRASSFALSRMSPEEVEGLHKTFGLYLMLPEELWQVVRYAEGKGAMAEEIHDALSQYAGTLLVESANKCLDRRPPGANGVQHHE